MSGDSVTIKSLPGRVPEMAAHGVPPDRATLLIRLSYVVTAHPWVSTDELQARWHDVVCRLWRGRQWRGRVIERRVYR